MIDTVNLLIPKEKTRFINGLNGWSLSANTENYSKFVRNPNKKEKDSGLYYPRITGYTRKHDKEQNIRIEFSAPKLLLGNNLDELKEGDFDELISVLRSRLEDMDLVVSESVLKEASVSSIHFSKNIKLEKGFRAEYVISQMAKVNARKNLDLSKTKYVNGGGSLYFHATTHQFVIYDKVADMGKAQKRAVDKEQTPQQMSIFDKIAQDKEMLEIVRFEIRLSRKQKLNQMMNKLGFGKNLTFEQIFRFDIARAVVLDYWENYIKSKSYGLFARDMSLADCLENIFLANEDIKPKQAIYLLGLYQISRDEDGMRKLRSITNGRIDDRNWYRIVDDMKTASNLITKDKLMGWVRQIEEGLYDFLAYRR